MNFKSLDVIIHCVLVCSWDSFGALVVSIVRSFFLSLVCSVLENAWKVQDWTAMKEASAQGEPICSEHKIARLNLLRGFLALCYPDEQRLSAIEKLIEAASVQSIKQWRRLPRIVSNAHVQLLQLAQQIMELQEATTIHSGLQGGGLNRNNFQTEIKTIFKTWK